MEKAFAFLSILTVVSALGNLTAEEEAGSKTREKKGNLNFIVNLNKLILFKYCSK
jgi:hypothetical protein